MRNFVFSRIMGFEKFPIKIVCSYRIFCKSIHVPSFPFTIGYSQQVVFPYCELKNAMLGSYENSFQAI